MFNINFDNGNNPLPIDRRIHPYFPGRLAGDSGKSQTNHPGSSPEAREVISYQMPAFKLCANLVHFAGFENHIGFYPTFAGIETFKHRFNNYKWAKDLVQFLLDQPIPYDLIGDIKKFRLRE